MAADWLACLGGKADLGPFQLSAGFFWTYNLKAKRITPLSPLGLKFLRQGPMITRWWQKAPARGIGLPQASLERIGI